MSKFILLHLASSNEPIVVNVDNISCVISDEKENTTSIYNLNEYLVGTVTESATEIYKKLEHFMQL